MAEKEIVGAHFAKLADPADEAASADVPAAAPKHAAPKHAAPEPPAKERRFPWGALVALVVALATLCAVYLGGVHVFSERFLPNTTLDGQDVSLLTLEEVAAGQGAETSGYTLAVEAGEFSCELTAADVGLKSDGMVYARAAIEQIDPWRWPLEIAEPRELSVERVATFDPKQLEDVLGAKVDEFNKGAKKPVDAKVAFDDESKLFAVVPAVPGTQIDGATVVAAAAEAIATLEPAVTIGEEALVPPKVPTDDPTLTATVDKVNASLGATQTLKLGDEEVFTFDAAMIARFAKVSDTYEVTVDEEALRTWCQGELSDKLDSQGRPRSFTRPDGKGVRVTGGTYGWNIDGATLAKTIAANVLAGKAGEVEVPTFSSAELVNPGGQDWGKRYIDIDLSEQHVRMYGDDGALIWETDCVTGKTDGHETPTGVYTLNDNKEQGNIRLEGREDEKTGKPEYVSYVTYWMPFIWNSVALHDATWRYSFGGDIYRYDGSHGCVNLPYDKAEELFGISRVGDVVVVHY